MLISAFIFSHKSKKAMCITRVPNIHRREKTSLLRRGIIFQRFSIQTELSLSNEGPAASINLDPWDLSDSGPPTRHHLIWGPQHTYSRGLPGLGSVREDAPNPQETGGPREFRVQVGLGVWFGDILLEKGNVEEEFNVKPWEMGQKGNNNTSEPSYTTPGQKMLQHISRTHAPLCSKQPYL